MPSDNQNGEKMYGNFATLRQKSLEFQNPLCRSDNQNGENMWKFCHTEAKKPGIPKPSMPFRQSKW
jgi:hypothetical protein